MRRGTAKIVALMLLTLTVWGVFVSAMLSHQDKEFLQGLGFGAGVLTFMCIAAIADMGDD